MSNFRKITVVTRFLERLIVTQNDVTMRKPHPQGLLDIMKRFWCTNKDMIHIWDGWWDVEAAIRAKIGQIFLLEREWEIRKTKMMSRISGCIPVKSCAPKPSISWHKKENPFSSSFVEDNMYENHSYRVISCASSAHQQRLYRRKNMECVEGMESSTQQKEEHNSIHFLRKQP